MTASTVPAMAHKPTSPFAGCQPISSTSTTQKHPLGTIIRGVDEVYGESEFMYVVGVASCALGDALIVDSYNGNTYRAVHTTHARGILGIAMSALTAALYGWVMISGAARCTANTACAAGAKLFLTSTGGQLDDAVVSTDKVDGAVCTVAEGDSPGAGTLMIVAQFARPSCNGNG